MESTDSNVNDLNFKEHPYSNDEDCKLKSTYNNSNKACSNYHSPTESVRKRNLITKLDDNTDQKTSDILKKEFILFCQNTTIRGVSRIVRSTDKKLFALWLGFFMFLCFGLLVCMFFLLRQFLEYDVIHPPRIARNENSSFPSFTVCNLRPLSPTVKSFLASKDYRNPREFATRLNRYALNQYLYRNESKKYVATTAIASMGGYLESMPDQSYMTELGHQLNDMIIFCKVTNVEGSQPSLDDCNNVGEWRRILHPQYLNCHSFNLHHNASNSTATIELFVYLAEEVNTTICIDCFFSNVKTQLSGASLVIHHRESYPDINEEGVNLQPGTLTEVKLKTIRNIMKTPPYGRCSEYTPSHIYLSNALYGYTEKACKHYTLQQKINEACGCKTIEYPIIDNSSLPFCTSLPNFLRHDSCQDINVKNTNITLNKSCIDDIERAIDKAVCKGEIISSYRGDIIKGCSVPCLYYSYESDRSISTWPTKSYHLSWIQSSAAKSIRSKPELVNYFKAFEKYKEGNEEAAYEILTSQNTLEKKLLGVVINKPNSNLHIVKEKEVLSLTSCLSQSGGLLSMWIGLTMINIVEVLEMLIRFTEIKKSKYDHGQDVSNILEVKVPPYPFHITLSTPNNDETLESSVANIQSREAVI